MRQIEYGICSCGGSVIEVEVTDNEEQSYGCHRKGCCVRVLWCDRCKTRFILKLEAPEIE